MTKRFGKLPSPPTSLQDFLDKIKIVAEINNATTIIVVLSNETSGRSFQYGCDDSDFLKAIGVIAKHALI